MSTPFADLTLKHLYLSRNEYYSAGALDEHLFRDMLFEGRYDEANVWLLRTQEYLEDRAIGSEVMDEHYERMHLDQRRREREEEQERREREEERALRRRRIEEDPTMSEEDEDREERIFGGFGVALAQLPGVEDVE